jgi:hypothetical protein
MVVLLAIWLRSLSMLAKKIVCTTSYGSAPGNMVASINLATAEKMVARPRMVARHPMVPLLAIWLRSISMLAKKNVCTTSYGSAPGNMVASINLATAKKKKVA